MALRTVGTTTTIVLGGFQVGADDAVQAQVNLLQLAIKDDQIVGFPIFNGGYTQRSRLFVPNRGVLQCRKGDFIAVDPITGWPILISAAAIAAAGTSWAHS